MVNTAILKEYSNWILDKDNRIVNEKREITNINIVKKYLFISLVSKLILEKKSLFINTFLGLLKERIWFMEYFVNEYIFRNLKPELVEKKEPPIITNIKNTKSKLDWFLLREKPMLDMLLEIDRKLFKNWLLKLKKRKKIVTIKT